MFGKGHKRKLDEDEAGLEGKAPEAVAAEGTEGGLSKVSYTLQRQTIFNISLMKLYAPRPGEQSLQRRVLINNMLRRIQDELKRDGTLRPLLLPPSPPPDDPLDEGYHQAPPNFAVLSQQPSALIMAPPPAPLSPPPLSPHPMMGPAPPSFLPAVPPTPAPLQDCTAKMCPPEACLTPASLLEDDHMESMENVTVSIASTLPTPPASPRLRLRPSLELDHGPRLRPSLELDQTNPMTRTNNASSTVSTSQIPTREQSRAKPDVAGVLQAELRLMDASDATPTPPSAGSGFLSDLALDDVLFADIDTSMYDFDACTTTTTTTATGNAAVLSPGVGVTKMAPLVTTDDLIKSLASPYSGPAPQVSPNQPFKIDLTELDHIMEVLVGS